LVGAAISVWLGQDANWDLRNYHLYNAFWLLNQRDLDVAPAGQQSFYSPFIDVPYYLMSVKWLAPYPRIVAAIQGLYFGWLIFVVFRINAQLFPERNWSSFLLALVATVIGATGAATLSEVGTTLNDIQVATLILSGLLLLLSCCDGKPGGRPNFRAAGAGVLLGCAAGLKLTGAIYAPAAVGALVVCVRPFARSAAVIAALALGWLAGFALTHGSWGALMWSMTGNPLFPFYNGIFHSEWYPPVNFSTDFFKIGSWLNGLVFPFYWLRSNSGLVTEMEFRDARLAMALCAWTALAAMLVFAPRLKEMKAKVALAAGQFCRLRCAVMFAGISYAIWLVQFTILRYAIAIEALSGAILVIFLYMAAGWIMPHRLRAQATVLSSFAVLAVLLLCTVPPDWGRIPYGERVFSVGITQLPADSLIVLDDQPLTFVLPLIAAPGMVAIGVTWMTLPGYRVYEESKRRIAEHVGPLFVLKHANSSYRRLIAELGVVWDELLAWLRGAVRRSGRAWLPSCARLSTLTSRAVARQKLRRALAGRTRPIMVLSMVDPVHADEREGYTQRIRAFGATFADHDRLYVQIKQRPGQFSLVPIGEKALLLAIADNDPVGEAVLRMALRGARAIYAHSILPLASASFWKLIDHQKAPFILDLHGAVPEEFLLQGEQQRAQTFERIEGQAARSVDQLVCVTDKMAQHFQHKHQCVAFSPIICPTFEPLNSSSDPSRKYHSRPRVVYAGGAQAWQQIGKLAEVAAHSCAFADFIILTPEIDVIARELGRQGLSPDFRNVALKAVTHREVLEICRDCDFGLLLRASSVINRVSCPTKLVEYLAAGVIPILDSPEIGDFADLGLRYVRVEDFMRGVFPSLDERRELAARNLVVLEQLKSRSVQGVAALAKLFASRRSPERALHALSVGVCDPGPH
jgi:hypothetical protein